MNESLVRELYETVEKFLEWAKAQEVADEIRNEMVLLLISHIKVLGAQMTRGAPSSVPSSPTVPPSASTAPATPIQAVATCPYSTCSKPIKINLTK